MMMQRTMMCMSENGMILMVWTMMNITSMMTNQLILPTLPHLRLFMPGQLSPRVLTLMREMKIYLMAGCLLGSSLPDLRLSSMMALPWISSPQLQQ
jgi:hypothetical protein